MQVTTIAHDAWGGQLLLQNRFFFFSGFDDKMMCREIYFVSCQDPKNGCGRGRIRMPARVEALEYRRELFVERFGTVVLLCCVHLTIWELQHTHINVRKI